MYPGALSPVFETFVPPFLPTRLTAPGSPRMGYTVIDQQMLQLSLFNKVETC